MLLRLLCRERGLTPRFREVPHDEVLDAASGTTGALVIGDAGFAAAARFPHVVDLGAAWRDADRAAVRLRGAGRAGPARSAPTTSRCLQESLARGWRRAPRSRAPGPRRTAAIRPTTSATWCATSATSWAPRSCPACRRSSIARAPPSCSRAPVRPRLFEARARIAPRAAPARRRDPSTPCCPTPPPARACRPTTRSVCTPTRRRWSWAPPPTRAARRCTPTARSPTSSIATSTTRTSA